MDNTQLQHWGIKGMKWGVRRYQNKDGSLTDLGKKRMYQEQFDFHPEAKNKGDMKNYVADPHKWVGEDMQNEKRVLDESANMARNIKTATDNSIRNAKNTRPKMDLSSMSDKQMRDEINRALLERQYNDMFAPQKSTKGREYVSRTLEVAGGVLAIGGTALNIALAIKQLRGG